jgi:hypothetical protein
MERASTKNSRKGRMKPAWFVVRLEEREIGGMSAPPEGKIPEEEHVPMGDGWFAIFHTVGAHWLLLRADADRVAARISGATVHEWSVS